MVFKSGAVLKDWRSAVMVPLCKGKEERTEYRNYRDIILLSLSVRGFYIRYPSCLFL